MIACFFGRGRNTSDQNIGIRKDGQRILFSDQDIATGDDNAVGVRSVPHEMRVVGLLQIQKRLADVLPRYGSEAGQRQHDLTFGRIGW